LQGGDVRELYEADLAVIRPDHYIAWRGSAVPEDLGAVLDIARDARFGGCRRGRGSDRERVS
jgi:hypothetical protein